MVAKMVEALEVTGEERVLDIGTGSGYQAAVLGELARDVWSLEIVPELADEARERLSRLGYSNVHAVIANGIIGPPGEAPFDAIVVAAAAPDVPQALVDQLGAGGRLVVPTGELRRIRKIGNRMSTESLLDCMFVPLVGKAGWRSPKANVRRSFCGTRTDRSTSATIRTSCAPSSLRSTSSAMRSIISSTACSSARATS